MTNTERVALLPCLDDATPEQIERANAAVEANLINGVPRWESAQGYACALTAIMQSDTRTIPNVDELVRAAYLEGHHRGRCDPSLTIWHSADEDWETSKIRAALNQEKDARG